MEKGEKPKNFWGEKTKTMRTMKYFCFVFSNMVRSYKRKFEKPDENAVANAVTEIKNGERINTMTLKYGIPRGVLRSRLKDSAHTAVVDTQRYKQVNKLVFRFFVDDSLQ